MAEALLTGMQFSKETHSGSIRNQYKAMHSPYDESLILQKTGFSCWIWSEKNSIENAGTVPAFETRNDSKNSGNGRGDCPRFLGIADVYLQFALWIPKGKTAQASTDISEIIDSAFKTVIEKTLNPNRFTSAADRLEAFLLTFVIRPGSLSPTTFDWLGLK